MGDNCPSVFVVDAKPMTYTFFIIFSHIPFRIWNCLGDRRCFIFFVTVIQINAGSRLLRYQLAPDLGFLEDNLIVFSDNSLLMVT